MTRAHPYAHTHQHSFVRRFLLTHIHATKQQTPLHQITFTLSPALALILAIPKMRPSRAQRAPEGQSTPQCCCTCEVLLKAACDACGAGPHRCACSHAHWWLHLAPNCPERHRQQSRLCGSRPRRCRWARCMNVPSQCLMGRKQHQGFDSFSQCLTGSIQYQGFALFSQCFIGRQHQGLICCSHCLTGREEHQGFVFFGRKNMLFAIYSLHCTAAA